MTRVVMMADGGPGIGLGHLRRSLALAAALREAGAEPEFVVPDAAGLVERAAEFPATAVADLTSTDPVIAADAPLAVVDSYRIGDEYLLALRDAGMRVAAIDDVAGFPFSAHVVVNGAPGAERLEYTSASGDTTFLLGARYALLGREFWDDRGQSLRATVANVLVTVGGADNAGVAASLVAALDGVEGAFGVTVVAGPFAAGGEELDTAAREARRQVTVVRGPSSLRDLMLNADLAVSGAGQTLLELARTGTPAVAIELADNQETQLRALVGAGAVVDAGSITDDGATRRAAVALAQLAGDRAAREGLAARAAALIDGGGPRRVAEAILD